MTTPTNLKPYAVGLLLLLPVANAMLVPAPHLPASTQPMQADDDAPVWAALQALDLPQARWAQLLTSDADGNGRTDFLDLAAATAAALGQPDQSAELLAYAPPEALARIVADVPGAVAIDGQAAFLTASLSRLDALEAMGATLLVWEPRAAATVATPGVPGTLPQSTLHQAADAWTLGFDGTGVRIAVLDTGIAPGHDAFATAGKISSWKDCIGASAVAIDPHGHGSHVASIAAGDDGTDFRGVAYLANLVSVRVLDATGSGTLASFQCGVDYVRGLKLAGGTPIVATASLGLSVPVLGLTTLNGGQLDLFLFDRVADKLPLAGVPFTVAAGNYAGLIEITDADESTQVGVNGVNQVSSPGFASLVVTVGSVTNFEARSTFSAIGPGKLEYGAIQVKPDVMAHGSNTWGANAALATDYIVMSGTSMATPGVAGVVAMLLEDDGTLTPAEVKQALRDGAEAAWLITDFAAEPLHPNFSSGYGVAKAANSLALV